jgi:nucleoside-diphosphate-sugar epimerase
VTATRFLVLGGLGFLGANVSRRLRARGYHVTAATRSLAAHREAASAFAGAGINAVEANLMDGAAMARLVPGHDVIINLAGESGAVRSLEEPLVDLDGNCRANLVLLDAIRAHNPAVKLVFIGSRLQYGKPVTLPVTEDHPRQGLSVHAVHKNAIEEYLRVYARLFGLRYTVARVTNPFGPGQPAARVNYGVVNRMIHLALADQPIPIYGDGLQQRDYVYVDDVSEALVRLAEQDAADGRAFNVGSGAGTALIDMANAIIHSAGGGSISHVPWPRLAEQLETGDFIADVTRIEREIGWRPSTSLSDGLARTVAYQRLQQPS